MTAPQVGRFNSETARATYGAAYAEGMAVLPEPAQQWDVRTAFGTVRVYRFGDAGGVPLVLLNGRAGTTVMWRPNLRPLMAKKRVYAIDLLGEAGLSEQTAPIRTAADQAAWLGEVLAALDLDKLHLVGVSIGGWLACNQAVLDPSRLASISLLDPAMTFSQLPLKTILRSIPVALPWFAERALPGFLHYIDGQQETAADSVEGRLIGAGIRDYKTAAAQPTLFTDEQLRSIGVPTLAVIGGRSVIHDPAKALARAKAMVPGIQAELWPEATHAISGQFADRVNQRVLDFVAAVEDDGHEVERLPIDRTT